MKKDQYFNLEVNFLSNDNIVRMMMELDAAQSLGIYMMLLTLSALYGGFRADV